MEEQVTTANQILVKSSDLLVLTRNYSHLPKVIKVSLSVRINDLEL